MSEVGGRDMAAAIEAAVEDEAGRSGLRAWLAGNLEAELEEGVGFLWLPVLFGAGILVYFVLPGEPSTVAVIGAAVVAMAAAWASRGRLRTMRFLVAIAVVAVGAATTKIRTDTVAAPKLPREMTALVTGWVAARETATRGGVRVVLRVVAVEGLDFGETPYAVRVTIRSRTQAIAVGDAIEVTARMRPPNGPVLPGGYDFARSAFYERIGGVGFAYGAARPADLGVAPAAIRVSRPLERLRQTIGERVMAALPGDRGRVATALITGDRGGISTTTQEAMRASGLGHILAISGLHMALVAGSAFWLIRALLALSPRLASRRPIKKWAAVGSMLIATAYLGISGGHVATQRAYVMLVIMLLAILVDRRAITLRNVALAALVVLLLAPESLLTASFQMSFAATVALVAVYEQLAAWSERRPRLTDRAATGVPGKMWRYAAGLALTSLIAGLATTPFAIYHFQRMAPLSLLANLLAMPVLGIAVMPMAFVAVVLMPFGLEWIPLGAMNWGLGWIIAVADRVNGLSGEIGGVRALPPSALGLLVVGFLWLALWRRPWRLLGLVALALLVPVAVLAPRPDILLSSAGNAAAVRGEDGRFSVIAGPGSRFAIENWLRADADPRRAGAGDLSNGIACDPLGCVAAVKEDESVAVVLRGDAFAEDCHFSDVIVSRLPAPPQCDDGTAIVIDRQALARHGAHALYRLAREGNGRSAYRIVTAYPDAGRPWMPGFSSGE